jgi:DnaJ-class molecular chaperone
MLAVYVLTGKQGIGNCRGCRGIGQIHTPMKPDMNGMVMFWSEICTTCNVTGHIVEGAT